MANFSVNQSKQLYVLLDYDASNPIASAAAGTMGEIKEVEDVLGKQVMFLYKGVDTVLKSDLIQVKNIGFAKAIAAADMVITMKKIKVALAGSLVAGQDYILGIDFKNFFSSGDASQYYKNAVVHATSSMTAAQFYTAMKNALDLAFSREDGATASSNPYLTFTADSNGVYIEEKPQEWVLGTKKARRIMFDVLPSTIYSGGDDVIWGTVEDITDPAHAVVGTNAIGNGQQIADLEWFCMGERGDQYRNVGWPNVIPTTYLVNPSLQYHVLEIHYAFTDSGTGDYRTEKEITIVAPTSAKSDFNDFIDALEVATGLTIAGIA